MASAECESIMMLWDGAIGSRPRVVVPGQKVNVSKPL